MVRDPHSSPPHNLSTKNKQQTKGFYTHSPRWLSSDLQVCHHLSSWEGSQELPTTPLLDRTKLGKDCTPARASLPAPLPAPALKLIRLTDRTVIKEPNHRGGDAAPSLEQTLLSDGTEGFSSLLRFSKYSKSSPVAESGLSGNNFTSFLTALS